jgi:nucleotide-binding universal stress UspA family protein
MFERLLVPIDGTPNAERAMTASIALARKLQAAIVGFMAEPDLRTGSNRRLEAAQAHPKAKAAADSPTLKKTPGHPKFSSAPVGRWDGQSPALEGAQKVLQQFQAQATAADVPFEGVVAYTAEVDDAIISTAQQQHCDLIVMVTHGRGAFGERLFGSHTKSVMSKCQLPLLVLR